MLNLISILLSIWFSGLFGDGQEKCHEVKAIFIGAKPTIIQKTSFECETGVGTIPEVTFP